MAQENDFGLNEAALAARRLDAPMEPSPLERLRGSSRELDERLPLDPSLDPVTRLRSALDYTEIMAAGAVESSQHDVRDFIKRLMDYFMLSNKDDPADNLLRSIEASAIVGMIDNFAVLKAALETTPADFVASHPSAAWKDEQTKQLIITAVEDARIILDQLAMSARAGRKRFKDPGQLITALQNEIYKQVNREITKSFIERRAKVDKAKKIGGQIIRPQEPNQPNRHNDGGDGRI